MNWDDATAVTPRQVERWWGSWQWGLEWELVTCSGCRQGRRPGRRWARRWVFSGKTGKKNVTCFPWKQPENMLPFCWAKPWQTDYVFSWNTDKEKDNVFPWETVGIKITFFCLFPWKTIKEIGFLFQIQTDGIILLCFLFVYVGHGLSIFQANTNFTHFPRLFSWKTVTIPSSVNLCQDSFEVHAVVISTMLKPAIYIVLAGIRVHPPCIPIGSSPWSWDSAHRAVQASHPTYLLP